MDDLKPWWTSKAIWTGLIGSAWGVAGALGLLPAGLSQAEVLTVVLAITGIGGVVFRKTARRGLGNLCQPGSARCPRAAWRAHSDRIRVSVHARQQAGQMTAPLEHLVMRFNEHAIEGQPAPAAGVQRSLCSARTAATRSAGRYGLARYGASADTPCRWSAA